MFYLRVILSLICTISTVTSKTIAELQGTNFELSLTSYKYLAVLFYDDSPSGITLQDKWTAAGDLIKSLPAESEMGKINGHDPELQELIEAYSIAIPSIKVFRRGILTDYRGPLYVEGIAQFINEDAMPSVLTITTVEEMRNILQNNLNTILFGFFDETDMVDDSAEGYSIDAWGQFQAAADSLRGHASFYATSSEEILNSFKISHEELPSVYMVSNDNEGFLKYSGEILEINLSEWVLRNSAPAMGELTLSNPTGEIYATQFFSSRKMKFILFLTPYMVDVDTLDAWKKIAVTFQGQAIFSFMTESSVADVAEYFNINMDTDLPLIAAHFPPNDSKYKSKKLNLHKINELLDFVTGVVTGIIPKIIKSEPEYERIDNSLSATIVKALKSTKDDYTENYDIVMKAVGNNVIDIVSTKGKDVLLLVYTPWCNICSTLLPTYELLGKAVQGEDKIVIAKINALKNDIPTVWGVKTHPTLLWFTANDKEQKTDNENSEIPIPRPYWDAGFSLQELVGFVVREGSFDIQTLKVATSEQLGSLAAEVDVLREKYEDLEVKFKRNERREVFDNPLVDFVLGEVVFDGTRAHILGGICLGFLLVLSVVFNLYYIGLYATKVKVIRKKKT